MNLKILALAAVALAVGSHQAPPSFKNIKISPLSAGGSPCEPSIAVSLNDPKNIVAGVIMDKAIYTYDGGKTWADVQLKSQYGVAGDPTVVSDAGGNFYYFHLSNGGGPEGWLDRIVCQKSTDGGKSWSDGASLGHNPDTDQDKQWAACHPTKPFICATWTQFDKYGRREPSFESNIMYSGSSDGGVTWSKSIKINDISGDCIDDDGTTEGAVPAVDKLGRVFVTWSNQGIIFFDRSYDGGKTWLKNDRAIARHYGGWNMTIPGINRSNGMPVLMVDNSPKATNGTLYCLWADQRAGTDDTDIFFIKSADQGDTWSKPLRVNKDAPGKHQFLPWLAVDQSSGNIYAVYYDRRAYDDFRTDVYVAWSVDGGSTFKETRISESPFTPKADRFFGDYNNISAHKGIIAPIWTRMDNGATTVWTAAIKHNDLK